MPSSLPPKPPANLLFVRPISMTFRPDQLNELTAYLQRLERNSDLMPIQDPVELTLNDRDRTHRGGYRLTSLCFQQVVGMLCRGGAQYIMDLAGLVMPGHVPSNLARPASARMLYNELIQLRYSVLAGCRLLRNDLTHTIDGLVGPKFHSYENLSMLGTVTDTLRQTRPDMRFHGAYMIGRKLLLWYRDKSPFHTLQMDGAMWRFYYGYYLRNAETSGVGVRGCSAVFTPRGSCLSQFEKASRVVHVGSTFETRLRKMLEHTLNSSRPASELATRLTAMRQQSLGYTMEAERGRLDRTRLLSKQLGQLGIPTFGAKQCLEDTLRLGSRVPTAAEEIVDKTRVYSTRTVFDLFSVLVRTARALPVPQREAMEQVAYQVLLGKFI